MNPRRYPPIFLGIGLTLIISLVVSLPVLIRRWSFEEHNKTYNLCLEYEEIERISILEGEDLTSVLDMFREAGVDLLSLYQEPRQRETVRVTDGYSFGGMFSAHVRQLIQDAGMGLLVRPLNPQYLSDNTWRKDYADKDLPPGADIILSAGDEVYGYPGRLSLIAGELKKRKAGIAWLEFGGQKGGKRLARLLPRQAVRTHSIDTGEMASIPDRKILLDRLVRAVKERGVRLLYLHLLAEKGIDGNIAFVRTLTERLADQGFRRGRPATETWRGGVERRWFPGGRYHPLRQIAAWCVAWFVPVAGIMFAWKITGGPASGMRLAAAYIAANTFSLAGGMLIAALFSIPEFMSGLYVMRGIKLSMLVPVIAAVCIAAPVRQIGSFWSRPVRWGEVCILGTVLAACVIILMRSGNTGFMYDGQGLEARLRDLLERWLTVRPRTKEFLIGQPALIFMLWYAGRHRSLRPAVLPLAVRAVFIAAIIGQISVVNTFMHVHTPLAISMVRTVHGIWLGAVIGLVVVLVYAVCAGRFKNCCRSLR